MTDPTITPSPQDAIDALFRQAAARDHLNQVLDGKTADERRDILILLLCRSVGELAQQNEALGSLLSKTVAVVNDQAKRIDELESKSKNVRGPFIQRILNRDG